MTRTPVTYGPHPNTDERAITAPARYIGNFHKSLPHQPSDLGDVDPAAYEAFVGVAAHTLNKGDFETVAEGSKTGPHQTPLNPIPAHVAKLVNPQAGRATDLSGPDPLHLEMQPAPRVLSQSAAAEMTELYWMALLRDVSFDTWGASPDIAAAVTDLTTAFQKGLNDPADAGRLQLGADLPSTGGGLDLRTQTLFRAGLRGEQFGPLVSQFLLQDFNYGAHFIQQTVVPYRAGKNYLTKHSDWLLAQNTGYDMFRNDYGGDNNYAADKTAYETPPVRVRLRNMRDIARFVNRDALHQAYFNAALQLLNWGVKSNAHNFYQNAAIVRQLGFGTLGGPNILALVSEVATRALKVVWRQKWLVHRRHRPEAYGGLMQMQMNGLNGAKQAYGLPAWVFNTEAAKRVVGRPDHTYFLPMAYSAGSPTHPSYGAGHASVAGACVTILKAWFADANLVDVINMLPAEGKDPGDKPRILQPGANGPNMSLPDYTDAAKELTIHGELNKLAANVALGRSMGGVHWRSDNTRSLRLGERVATIMLKRLLPTYSERPLSLSYINFDGDAVTIHSTGAVKVVGHQDLTDFYARA